MVNDSPNVRSQGKSNSQAKPSGPNSEAAKRKHFYVVTGRLWFLSVNVYAFLNLGADVFFVRPVVAMNFDVIADDLIEAMLQWKGGTLCQRVKLFCF